MEILLLVYTAQIKHRHYMTDRQTETEIEREKQREGVGEKEKGSCNLCKDK